MPEPVAAGGAEPRVEFESAVVQQIRRHARSSMDAEICGVLIGAQADGVTKIAACIAGEKAAQGGAHVTFTQATWEHIYKIKDAEFPEQAIVGWYHSHPGFGIFLSDYDLFIHENFFSAPHQVAWVFDPHSDEEGCFGWIDKKVVPLRRVTVLREHRGPEVGAVEAAPSPQADRVGEPEGKASSRAPFLPRLLKIAAPIVALLAAFGLGFLSAAFLGVSKLGVIIVDPNSPAPGRPAPTPSPAPVAPPMPALTAPPEPPAPASPPIDSPPVESSPTIPAPPAHAPTLEGAP